MYGECAYVSERSALRVKGLQVMRLGVMRGLFGLSCWLVVAGWMPRVAVADEDPVQDIVAVLRQNGLIDEAQETQILAKNAVRQTQKAADPLGGWELSGDFRLRYESFFFDTDDLDSGTPNRNRYRYRVRLAGRKKLLDGLTLGLRLASGTGDGRSTNQSLGDSPDFKPDPITIDRAFLEYKAPETSFGLQTKLMAGKTPNPFMWNKTPDLLIWDGDLSLEGASVGLGLAPSERYRLFANAGFYTVQDIAGRSADPKIIGLQLGGSAQVSDELELGFRVSSYQYRSLDSGFLARSMSGSGPTTGGNLSSAFSGDKARVGEAAFYVNYSLSSDWPVSFYVDAAKNFSADSAFLSGVNVDDEDQAIGVGFQIGDASRIARFGLGFFQVEANSVISLYTDSDVLDGMTNGKGIVFYISRKLRKNLELRFTGFDADSLRGDGGASGPFAASLANRDRRRFQADLILGF